MRRSIHISAGIVVLLGVSVLPAAAEEAFDEVRAYIERQMVDGHPASVTVGVSRDGETIWSESWGWANREGRVPADEHTMYSLASISKPVTATGLMVMVERGKIDLDRPIDDYLGLQKLTGHAGAASAATVRRVAGHTAGLPLHYQFFYEDEPYVRPSMDETIRRYGILVTRPGERYQYCNLGYGILDYAVERMSGERFEDFMRRAVFLPLGMTHTSIGVDDGLKAFAAERYAQDGRRIPFYDFDHRGASAVYASAHDLLRFGNFHIGLLPDGAKEILKKSSREAMWETSEISDYGIGWRVAPHPTGADVVSHSGGMGGVSTKLNLVPERGLVVTALSNSRDATAYRAADMIVDALLGKKRPAELPTRGEGGEATSSLVGSHWRGTVTTHADVLDLELWFQADGDVHAKLGEELRSLVNNARVMGDRFSGRMAGDIGTPDVNRLPYYLHFDLTVRGEEMDGALVAMSRPGRRVGNALASWIRLERVHDDVPDGDDAAGE